MRLLLIFITLSLLPIQEADKRAEKERLKQPARITIAAPLSTIKSLILTESLNNGWRLVDESESRLVFQRTPDSMGWRLSLRLSYGGSAANPPRPEIAYTLAAQPDSSVLVLADAAVVALRPGGTSDRYNWNADKNTRAGTDAFLAKIKKGAEAGEGAKPPDAAPAVKPSPSPTPKCFDNGRRVPCAVP